MFEKKISGVAVIVFFLEIFISGVPTCVNSVVEWHSVLWVSWGIIFLIGLIVIIPKVGKLYDILFNSS